MKLSEWAKQNGLCYRTAHRLWKSGSLPCRAEQLSTGTILVHTEIDRKERVSLYGRVSSHDQKADLARQMDRLRDFAAANKFTIATEKTEIGSGLNGKRKGLLSLLSDKTITAIVIEHRDRLSRFGVPYIEAAMAASGKKLIVVNESESKDDLVQDFVDVVTSMCARIYGRRSAKNKAKRALEAIRED